MSENPQLSKRGASVWSFLGWIVPIAMLAFLGWLAYVALSHPAGGGPSAPTVVSAGGYPKTIIEDSGRKVVLAARPERIIPSNAGLADILSALIEPQRFAGLPFTVEDYAVSHEFFKQHKEILRFAKFNGETLLSLNPDLILVSSFQDPATMLPLKERGIPVLTFEIYRTFAGIRQSILVVGSAVDEERKANALVEDFDRRLAAVEKTVLGRPKPRALSYSNYGEGFAVGTGESQDELLRRAGATNAAGEMNLTGHVHFTFEQMLKLNPDWIVVAGEDGLDSPQAKVVLNEPALADLPAVKNRKIAVVSDRSYSSVSQYVVDAVEILARQFHPDAFAAEKSK